MDKNSFSIPRIDQLDNLFERNEDEFLSVLSSRTPRGSIHYHNWEEQFPHRFPNYPANQHVMFRMAVSRTQLYVYWHMVSDGLKATHNKDLEPVAQDNCMEIFLQVPGNDEYWNFEVNALGALNASHRVERSNPTRLTHEQLKSVGRTGSHVNSEPFTTHNDTVWWVALAIPLNLIGLDGDNLPEYIKGNLYACAGGIERPYYISCFPINTPKPDFHRPEFFGKIYLPHE